MSFPRKDRQDAFDRAIHFDSDLSNPIKYAFLQVGSNEIFGGCHMEYTQGVDGSRSVKVAFRDSVTGQLITKHLDNLVQL